MKPIIFTWKPLLLERPDLSFENYKILKKTPALLVTGNSHLQLDAAYAFFLICVDHRNLLKARNTSIIRPPGSSVFRQCRTN